MALENDKKNKSKTDSSGASETDKKPMTGKVAVETAKADSSSSVSKKKGS